jgi:hypothetical protein
MDFNPWLAEHIDELGKALGLDLELVQTEGAVGDFAVDLVAKEVGSNRRVVVEKQLAATDHSHLGQLVTYAAGLEAEVVVWVSPEFREEHRQALDWLNRVEGAAEYFGVVLELIRVDNSNPAVSLRVVSSPKSWSRGAARKLDGELSSKRAAYQAFFQQLIDRLRVQHKFTNAKAGQPQNWDSFSSGTRGFVYSAKSASDGRLRVELYIDLGDVEQNKAAFDKLLVEPAAIETALGQPLEWERLDTKRAARIREGTSSLPHLWEDWNGFGFFGLLTSGPGLIEAELRGCFTGLALSPAAQGIGLADLET